MSRRMLHHLALISPLLVGCQRGPAPISEADKAAIRASTQQFVQGLMAKNWAALAAMYTPDATFMPPNEPAVKGPNAIQAWMAAFPPVSAFSAEDQEIEGSGDVAYVRGTYTMTTTAPGAPALVEDHGKFLEARRKQADGKWLMAADIFNSDVPMALPPAAAPGKRK